METPTSKQTIVRRTSSKGKVITLVRCDVYRKGVNVCHGWSDTDGNNAKKNAIKYYKKHHGIALPHVS